MPQTDFDNYRPDLQPRSSGRSRWIILLVVAASVIFLGLEGVGALDRVTFYSYRTTILELLGNGAKGSPTPSDQLASIFALVNGSSTASEAFLLHPTAGQPTFLTDAFRSQVLSTPDGSWMDGSLLTGGQNEVDFRISGLTTTFFDEANARVTALLDIGSSEPGETRRHSYSRSFVFRREHSEWRLDDIEMPNSQWKTERGFLAHMQLDDKSIVGPIAAPTTSISPPEPSDDCEVIALRNTRAIEYKEFVKKGTIISHVSQYRVYEKTHASAFCVHGGVCYLSESKPELRKMPALKLRNCSVIMEHPDAIQGDIFYDLQIIRAKTDPTELKRIDVTSELMRLGMDHIEAGNTAKAFIAAPNSKCGVLTKATLAGDGSAFKALLTLDCLPP